MSAWRFPAEMWTGFVLPLETSFPCQDLDEAAQGAVGCRLCNGTWETDFIAGAVKLNRKIAKDNFSLIEWHLIESGAC